MRPLRSRPRRPEKYLGVNVRDFIERLVWTVAPVVAGWVVVHIPAVSDAAGGQDATLAAVAAVLTWGLTYVWRTVSKRLPNPGDGVSRRLPTAQGMGAGWRQ